MEIHKEEPLAAGEAPPKALPQRRREGQSDAQAEVAAIGKVAKALEELSPAAQARVLGWALASHCDACWQLTGVQLP